MLLRGIQIPDQLLADFCRRHGVTRLSLFGAILREDFRPDSDIDVLVEFAPNTSYSLLDLGGMLMELREMLGREIDLKTPSFLSPRLREQVAREAQVLYAA